MSASTVSITANPAAAARRRPVEKKSNLDFPPNDAQPNGETAGNSTRDLIRDATAIAERSAPSDLIPAVKKAVSVNNGTTTTQRRTRKAAAAASKPEKPLWKRVVSIFAKNFVALLFLVGVFQVVRKVVMRSPTDSTTVVGMGLSELEGQIAEIDGVMKTTTKMMQVQVELLDKKLDAEAAGWRKKMDETAARFESEFKNLDARNDRLETSLNELNANSGNFASKEDLERLYEELKKGRNEGSSENDVNVDELRAYARDIVEKELEKHAADGLGRVDYALASGGAFVVKHSEPFLVGKTGNWFAMNSLSRVHSHAAKMLTPSFGEPGQCFALTGTSGFVQIRLRVAIIPEAVTLEHVSKSVAYDRSSAPKDCRVSGWLQGQDINSPVDSERMFLLTEFTYDLDKSNAQTFEVVDSARSGLVDTVRLDFTSNHGSPKHTCIYRLRVHGHIPASVSVVPKQP